MNRREDVNSQGLDSTPSASDGTAPADTYSRTPNNTPQANGEGDIHGRRAGMLNNASHEQPTATNIDDILPNWSPKESRALAEAFHSQNDEPSVCISELMTYSPDGWDFFHNNFSGTPLATAAENPALLSVPPINHFNPQADHSNRTSFSNSPPATHTVTNSTSEEASPAYLSDYLPRVDPATQEQREVAWIAELSGNAFNPMHRPNTPLLTDEIENGNAEARGSLGNIPSVYVGSLRLGTPTREMDAVPAGFSQYPEDEASSAAPGEDIVAGSETNPTNPRGRRRITPLADSDPDATRVTNGGVHNHNHRAPRPVPSLRRMSSGERRTFWGEFSNPEDDSKST